MKKSEIKKIYEKFSVPQNIILHMQKVAELSGVLADRAKEKGIKVRKNIIIKSALIHDVFKPDGKHHAKKMADYLMEINERSMANLVEKHDFWQIDKLKTWDEKILYYADKRAYEDCVVSLQTRIDEGRKRNPGTLSEEVIKIEEKMKELERDLSMKISVQF